MNAKYHFFTGFQLSGDRDAIWDTLQDAAAWPSWWRWVKRMETVHEPTGDNAVGGAYRNRMGSPLGIGYTYTFTVTDAERYRQIQLDSIGDLLGRGQWDIAEQPDGTIDVSFTWLVETTRWWMNLFAPIGRPALVWNHDRLMTDFARGWAKASGATLLGVQNKVVRPGEPGYFEMPVKVGPR